MNSLGFTRSQQRIIILLIVSALSAGGILVVSYGNEKKALAKIEVVHSAFDVPPERKMTRLQINSRQEGVSASHPAEQLQLQVVQSSTHLTGGRGPQFRDGRDKECAITLKININTASREKLESLPGIGPVTAKKIIDYREKKGGFKSIEEIMEVPRIGPKTFEKIKQAICVKDER